MLDFTDPSATEPGREVRPGRPRRRLSTSTTSPTRVEVPWPSTSEHVGRVEAGLTPGSLDAEPLADRVRRRDALALAVARPGDAADHRVDAVAVALGVGQALEHEDRRPSPITKPSAPSA